MKPRHLISLTAVSLLAVTGCDKQSPDIAKKIADLEQQNSQSVARQQQLEQELRDQKMAAEREGVERERARLVEDRAEMERQQGQAAAAKNEAILLREQELARRESSLGKLQSEVTEKQDELAKKSVKLSERDQELAGREALPFKQKEQREPVADYRAFYDGLSSYGSWFETADYGYVWQPGAVRDSNWRPYSRGRWVCSDRGWNWLSEEPFGWATYHYGRWALLRGRGWVWAPGTEWAPSWVSWRENDHHIGWAPLPPETLAYRGHTWDSTVDTQFGISSLWFNFVEVRHFGGSTFDHCLPVSGNITFFNTTTNITHIHVQNRQVICGGPQYRRLCDRIGKPLPFYRLEVDQRCHDSRDPLRMQPRIQGDRLFISAPNIDAEWNDGLRPSRLRGGVESFQVEREQNLSGEISNRFQQSRKDGRRRAEETIGQFGGMQRFEESRDERLQENRRGEGDLNRRQTPFETLPGPAIDIPDPQDTERGQQEEQRQQQVRQQEEGQRQQQQARQQEEGQRQQQAARQQEEGQRQQQQARQQEEGQRQQQVARQQEEGQRQQQLVRQQEENQRQQQEARQQEEGQRQQQVARQQEENQRQQQQARQQEEGQRQQQQARQQEEGQRQQQQARQQEENQRQQQQARQQEEGQRQQQQEQGRQQRTEETRGKRREESR
jgi:hypothetical protein